MVWWSTLSEKYREEMQAQSGVFGGEHGEQAQTDFRCSSLLSTSAVLVNHQGPADGALHASNNRPPDPPTRQRRWSCQHIQSKSYRRPASFRPAAMHAARRHNTPAVAACARSDQQKPTQVIRTYLRRRLRGTEHNILRDWSTLLAPQAVAPPESPHPSCAAGCG